MRPFVGAILKDAICAIFFFFYLHKKSELSFFFGLFGHLGGFRAPEVQFGTGYLAIILAKKTLVATSGQEEAKLYRRKKANYDIQVYRGINV